MESRVDGTSQTMYLPSLRFDFDVGFHGAYIFIYGLTLIHERTQIFANDALMDGRARIVFMVCSGWTTIVGGAGFGIIYLNKLTGSAKP